MEYRTLGNTELKVSIIGLGMEYLQSNVSRETVISVVHEAIDHGVNYFDMLASSPEVKDNFGAAFKGHRNDIILAGHLGIAETNGQYRKSRDYKECEDLFHDLLKRLDTDHLDVLHLHNIDEEDDYQNVIGKNGLYELAGKLKLAGKVRFICLSGHSTHIAAQAIKDDVVDVLMHPINIVWDVKGKRELLHLCAAEGVGVVAMKTYAGGAVFTEKIPVTPLQCIHYSLSQPAVATVVVGVKSNDELKAALRYLEASADEKSFDQALSIIQKDTQGMCVYCNHCLPCPVGIDVGRVNSLVSSAQYGVTKNLKQEYDALMVKASDCVECGACESRCPFRVDVVNRMHKASELFE
ncbi:MAG: aldo/keto reductase [Thermoclostridium sp.]|nr:aldo/keto reductase [Thermoclostridium sp.]